MRLFARAATALAALVAATGLRIESALGAGGAAPAPRSSIRGAETSHLDFVREYVRQLVDNDEIDQRNMSEIATATRRTDRLAAAILGEERMVLALTADAAQLSTMRLRGEFKDLPGLIVNAYDRKIDLVQRMMLAAAAALSDLAKAVDDPKRAADVSRLTASVETVERALFETTGLVFATLVDPAAMKDGSPGRLTITRAERQELIGRLSGHFGKNINEPGHGYTTASASLLKGLLLERKCADDPR